VKIYTKTGDRGETGLLGPLRVPKDHPRIAAYGEVDELNAAIGVALAVAAAGGAGAAGASRVVKRAARPTGAGSRSLRALLGRVQRDLFVVGSELATVPQPHRRAPILRPIRASDIAALEKAIDRATDRVPPLSNFILPGGTRLAAALHLARTVCRRAERAVVALSHAEPVPPNVIVYLNRLSDLLFVLARVANAEAGVGDVPWVPRKPKA
jgi:cob(I)alamin adenosyltransferase